MLLLCSRCGKVVILNVYKTGINTVSFSQFILSCVLRVFNSAVATSAQRLLGLSRVFDYDLYWRKRACMLFIFVPPTAVPLHYVVNLGSFHWTLSLFIYFRSMFGLLRSYCRWRE